jgi:hypothetical protein
VISSHIDNNRHNAEGITWYGGGIMRIYMSPHPDPMVLDSRKGMHAIYEILHAFLASDNKSILKLIEKD